MRWKYMGERRKTLKLRNQDFQIFGFSDLQTTRQRKRLKSEVGRPKKLEAQRKNEDKRN